ncbi:hypothetical protein [Microvirga rosea]|uniref:hypothetical protein n=1 Tax=Microvirga rosea TaxID=2715425 RepID=UPI001D0BB957|nr:hypothetical protein [Microvirga rosea]MCB8819930.1 hypothetical protein [Microvirga rosea]
MKAFRLVLSVASIGIPALSGAQAQQTSGVPGSTDATTMDGRYLPTPPQPFGGKINVGFGAPVTSDWGLYLLKGKPMYTHVCMPTYTWNLLDLKRERWEGTDALTPCRHAVTFDNISGLGRSATGELTIDRPRLTAEDERRLMEAAALARDSITPTTGTITAPK